MLINSKLVSFFFSPNTIVMQSSVTSAARPSLHQSEWSKQTMGLKKKKIKHSPFSSTSMEDINKNICSAEKNSLVWVRDSPIWTHPGSLALMRRFLVTLAWFCSSGKSFHLTQREHLGVNLRFGHFHSCGRELREIWVTAETLSSFSPVFLSTRPRRFCGGRKPWDRTGMGGMFYFKTSIFIPIARFHSHPGPNSPPQNSIFLYEAAIFSPVFALCRKRHSQNCD